MPITQWTCPSCKTDVPLSHFAETACGAVVHPDYAAAVLADRELQEGREGVRVSMGLSCPRKSAIMAAEEVAVDPLGMLSPLKGTAWHSLMEQNCVATNPVTGAEIEVRGNIAGVDITGKIDRVRYIDGKLIGEDWKTGSDFRVKYIKPTAKTPDACSPIEYRVQLSLYAELYRQQFGRAWDTAAIWWAFSNDMWAEPVAIIPLEVCLNAKPYACEWTVEQLLKQADAVFNNGTRWQDLPLAGKSIAFGTRTGCDYCAVRDVCWEEAFGAPF